MSASVVMWRRTLVWGLFAVSALSVAVLLFGAGRDARQVTAHSPLAPAEVHVSPRVLFRVDVSAGITGSMAERAGSLFMTTAAPALLTIDARGRIVRKIGLPAKSRAGAFIPGNGRVFCVLDDGRVIELVEDALKEVARVGGPVDTPLLATAHGAWVNTGHTVVHLDDAGQAAARFDTWGQVAASPTLGLDQVAYFGSQDDYAYAVRNDGSLVFKFDTGGDIDASPAVDPANGESFFANANGRVLALSASGAPRWERHVDGPVRASVVLDAEGRVVVATLGPRPALTWFDRETGKRLAETMLSFTDGAERGVTALAHARSQGVVAATPDGFALGFVAPGHPAWALPVRGELSAVLPLTSRAELVVADRGGLVQALRVEGVYSLLRPSRSL